MLRPCCAALALLLATPLPALGDTAGARKGSARPKARAAKVQKERKPAGKLEKALAQLAAVRRDPQRRKYRHHWERALKAVTDAAQGKDRAAGLLAAARGRYALYRFSQVESDRDEALRLGAQARKAGARDAATFVAAVRREAGDEPRPSRSAKRARPAPRGRPATSPPTPEPAEPDEDADEPSLDEALDKALAAGEQDDARPSPRPFDAVPEGPGLAAGSAPADGGPVRVHEVRSWSQAEATRVAVYLSRPARYRQLELPADGSHPRRLAIDIDGAVLDGAAAAHAVQNGQVDQVRTGQNGPSTVRVVLDLHGDEELRLVALEDPPRIIVDVGHQAAREARQSPLVAGRPEAEHAIRRPVKRIILDAGHGGHDTGAIGPGRVKEKDVTLALARKLKQRLEGQGYEVLLTRSDDRYLRLEERTWFANAHRGDLFVSLHVNAHPRRDRRGIETYVLNTADDRYARRLAARENGALSDDGAEGADAKRILADLNAQASAEPSRRLALQVQRELVKEARAQGGEARDRGVKSALFYVLLGAAMPAVLVETGFISNRTEEKRLREPRYQEALAQALARGIGAFARSEARVAAR
ncbi:MAG: N-acetylmuramoyl-L-alanine amidase [Deltaproteobacteria bacterium]|nr:N-acetylmuramoyl-L-alanine amidase [Deltaproteobacteria bacterium]